MLEARLLGERPVKNVCIWIDDHMATQIVPRAVDDKQAKSRFLRCLLTDPSSPCRAKSSLLILYDGDVLDEAGRVMLDAEMAPSAFTSTVDADWYDVWTTAEFRRQVPEWSDVRDSNVVWILDLSGPDGADDHSLFRRHAAVAYSLMGNSDRHKVVLFSAFNYDKAIRVREEALGWKVGEYPKELRSKVAAVQGAPASHEIVIGVANPVVLEGQRAFEKFSKFLT